MCSTKVQLLSGMEHDTYHCGSVPRDHVILDTFIRFGNGIECGHRTSVERYLLHGQWWDITDSLRQALHISTTNNTTSTTYGNEVTGNGR